MARKQGSVSVEELKDVMYGDGDFLRSLVQSVVQALLSFPWVEPGFRR
jgi:hypothetical protein